MDCFRCFKCNKPCSAKFYPLEQTINGVTQMVPLCEYDKFKLDDLICYNCDRAIRGQHMNCWGRKYHLDHFKCDVCDKPYNMEESFHTHDKRIYCRLHYSKFIATKCEGCQTSIFNKKDEQTILKRGRNESWHRDCLDCHNNWDVIITVEAINPPKAQIENYEIDISLVSHVLRELHRFDLAAATSLAAMLKCGLSGDKIAGLSAAASLALKVESLFKAIDELEILNVEELLQKAQAKEPDYNAQKSKYKKLESLCRNFSKMIIAYVSDLRNGRVGGIVKTLTDAAHYLRLIIRAGIRNALEYNKVMHNQKGTDAFLREINFYETLNYDDPFDVILTVIPYYTDDQCFGCKEFIESGCIKSSHINKLRWHHECIRCSQCDLPIDESKIKNSAFSESKQCVFCPSCLKLNYEETCKLGFEYVTTLMQIIYVTEIALIYVSYLLMYRKQHSKDDPDKLKKLNVNKRKVEQTFSQAVTDIKRLNSTHEVDAVANEGETVNFRLSTVVKLPQAKTAAMANQDEDISSGKESMQLNSRLEVLDLPSDDTPNEVVDFLKKKELALIDFRFLSSDIFNKEVIPNYSKHQRNRNQSKQEKQVSRSNSRVKDNVKPEAAPAKKRLGKSYADLSPEEHFIIRHIAIVALARLLGGSYTVERLLELIPNRKQQKFWGRLKSNNKKAYKGPKVFGAPLEELTEKYGCDSRQTSSSKPVRIPAVVDNSLAALRKKDMSVEGIFRKNGNIKKLRVATEEINELPEKLPDFNKQDQIQTAALVKRFLRDMPEPLFTFKLYDLWIESQKYDDQSKRKKILKLVNSLLPKANRDLLEVLLYFFKWVSSFAYIDDSTGSKMDINNLATVFAPNVLYNELANDTLTAPVTGANILKANNDAGDVYFLSIEVVHVLIESHSQLTTVPDDVMTVYNKMLQSDANVFKDSKGLISSKDLISNIETFVKQHAEILNSIDEDDDFDNDLVEEPQVVNNTSQDDVGQKAAMEG